MCVHVAGVTPAVAQQLLTAHAASLQVGLFAAFSLQPPELAYLSWLGDLVMVAPAAAVTITMLGSLDRNSDWTS